ncbi:MAG: MFS transporter [Acidimicrobiales bacterium]
MRRRDPKPKESAQQVLAKGDLSPAWFYGTIAAGSIGLAMTAPVTALYAKEFGASNGVAALVVSSMAVSLLIMDLVASRVVPRLDARTALIIGYLVFGVGSFASAVAPNLAIMTAARILQGFAVAFPQGAGFHMALRMAPPGGSGREIARFNAAAFIGLAVGPLIVGVVAGIAGGMTGLRWGFAVCGVVNVATAVVARVALPSIPSKERPELGLPSRDAFRGSRTRLAMMAAGLGFGLRGVIGMTLLPLLGDDIGAGVSGVALATMFMSVSELTGIMASGRLADRYGRLPVISVSSIGSVAALLWVLTGPSVAGYFAISVVMGVVLSALRVVPATMLADVAVNDEAAAIGWRLASDVNALATAVIVGSVLAVAGIYGGFAYAAGVAAVIGIIGLVLGETSRPMSAEPPAVASTVVPPGVPLAEAHATVPALLQRTTRIEARIPRRATRPGPGARVVPPALPVRPSALRPMSSRPGVSRESAERQVRR